MIETIVGIIGGFLILWVLLIIVLKASAKTLGESVSLKDALKLIPDSVKLLYRLTRDPKTPKKVRIALVVFFAYLVSPLDLIPDLIPVIGIADELIVMVLAIRFVVKHSGAEALDKHWSGSPIGLSALKSLAGVAA